MTFEDLPDHWSELPLTEPRLLDDVLDLVVGYHDREGCSLALLACDSEVRLVQPCLIGPGVGAFEPRVLRTAISAITSALEDRAPGGSVILALARPDGLSVTDDDRAWVRAAQDELARTDWRLSSAHVVTHGGIRRIAA